MFRLLRPRQWTKNLLLFAALVFAKELFDADAVVMASLGFAAFCLASSSVYIINDLLDAERDRLHPEKRNRPIASGAVAPGRAAVVAAALTAVSLALAFWIAPAFGISVALYVGLSHFYSLVGKNAVILDVLLIAFGFVIRAVAGALAIAVPISDWFILCMAFLALFLAVSKRKAELVALKEEAGNTRPVLERYTETSLDTYTAVTMAATLICYGLYVFDFQKQAGGDSQILILTLPVAVFGVFRYHHVAETTGMGDKPEEVLLRDRPIQLCALIFALVAVTALYLGL